MKVLPTLDFLGDPLTRETEKFIRMFDQYFDCLNVRSTREFQRKRKPNLKPYSSVNDPRFTVSYDNIIFK